LHGTGDFHITVADQSASALELLQNRAHDTVCADIASAEVLGQLTRGKDAVLSACPYYLTPLIAGAACDNQAHYFDLTEDVQSTRQVKALAVRSTNAMVPQCGLAPGFISIVGNDVAKRFDKLRSVAMRVGALPVYPTNSLKYNLTWSTDGLINEYLNPCEAIVDGNLQETPPLEEIEHFSLDGTEYEAFNTSGGLGTLCESLAGQVETLNYKTVRYPGHRDAMKMLVQDLRLGQRRDLFKDVLENALPTTMQDVVLVFVTVTGWKKGRLTQETYAKKIYAQALEAGGEMYSAIQLTTASGICTLLDLVLQGALPQQGFVRQEQVSLEMFLANRFGKIYA
jgi:saccharopine dehydrogenase-like NADP-dependent oxidoreductase